MRLGLRDLSRRSTAGVILAVAALMLSALTVRAPDAQASPQKPQRRTGSRPPSPR